MKTICDDLGFAPECLTLPGGQFNQWCKISHATLTKLVCDTIAQVGDEFRKLKHLGIFGDRCADASCIEFTRI